MEKLTNQQMLDFKFESEDLGATTIRKYLQTLLETLWAEGEGFNGKRPFGNSGWEYDLYKPLIACGAVGGSLDEDGFIMDFDRQAADKKVFRLIDAMCKGKP